MLGKLSKGNGSSRPDVPTRDIPLTELRTPPASPASGANDAEKQLPSQGAETPKGEGSSSSSISGGLLAWLITVTVILGLGVIALIVLSAAKTTVFPDDTTPTFVSTNVEGGLVATTVTSTNLVSNTVVASVITTIPPAITPNAARNRRALQNSAPSVLTAKRPTSWSIQMDGATATIPRLVVTDELIFSNTTYWSALLGMPCSRCPATVPPAASPLPSPSPGSPPPPPPPPAPAVSPCSGNVRTACGMTELTKFGSTVGLNTTLTAQGNVHISTKEPSSSMVLSSKADLNFTADMPVGFSMARFTRRLGQPEGDSYIPIVASSVYLNGFADQEITPPDVTETNTASLSMTSYRTTGIGVDAVQSTDSSLTMNKQFVTPGQGLAGAHIEERICLSTNGCTQVGDSAVVGSTSGVPVVALFHNATTVTQLYIEKSCSRGGCAQTVTPFVYKPKVEYRQYGNRRTCTTCAINPIDTDTSVLGPWLPTYSIFQRKLGVSDGAKKLFNLENANPPDKESNSLGCFGDKVLLYADPFNTDPRAFIFNDGTLASDATSNSKLAWRQFVSPVFVYDRGYALRTQDVNNAVVSNTNTAYQPLYSQLVAETKKTNLQGGVMFKPDFVFLEPETGECGAPPSTGAYPPGAGYDGVKASTGAFGTAYAESRLRNSKMIVNATLPAGISLDGKLRVGWVDWHVSFDIILSNGNPISMMAPIVFENVRCVATNTTTVTSPDVTQDSSFLDSSEIYISVNAGRTAAYNMQLRGRSLFRLDPDSGKHFATFGVFCGKLSGGDYTTPASSVVSVFADSGNYVYSNTYVTVGNVNYHATATVFTTEVSSSV